MGGGHSGQTWTVVSLPGPCGDGRGPEPHGRAAHGCPVAPARSPGRSALLRFYSEYPAHNAGVWLPQSSSGPAAHPRSPAVPPATAGPLSTASSLHRRQPQPGRGAGAARSRAGGERAGRSGQQAPGSIRRTPRSGASMKYSCSKWCNFVCIQPTSCIFQSIMK